MTLRSTIVNSSFAARITPLVLTILLLLAGCAPQRDNPLSNSYHNLTAHFNAYFIAKEHVRLLEEDLYTNYQWNYNKVLPIHVPFDSTDTASYKEQMEDCIQKASLAIQRHPGSNWEYRSYQLVGLARFYRLEFAEAVETYKYINTRSELPEERHEALIQLMRTYAKNGEFRNAISVADYLGREDLDESQSAYYYLNKAYVYQLQENMDDMVKNLVSAEERMKRTPDKPRIQFIIGQLYQELGFNALAFSYYKKCLRSSPSYDLAFYTKLNMAQVTELSETSDVKRIRKYFRKLLADAKNREYRDKIYYEMGVFEQKNNNLEVAISHFRSSVDVSENNQRQKGLSFLRLGQIHFDSLKAYKQAKFYYDSTIQVLPKDEDNYAEIKNRQEILEDFVKHITTIQVNDSLISLSKLSQDSLRSLALARIAAQQVEEEEKKEREKNRQRRQNAGRTQYQLEAALINTGSGSGGWYFSNPASVNQGVTTFQRIWGNRELLDDWRRSVKSSLQVASATTETQTDSIQSVPEANDSVQMEQAVQAFIAQVPTDEAQIQKMLDEIELAMYEVGNIYNFRLKEPLDAIETFETFRSRFPESTFDPEVLYQLYLLYREVDPDQSAVCAQTLITKYPESIYAKLINNPNYREESFALAVQLKEIYNRAYRYHEKRQFKESNYLLDSALRRHPDNEASAKLALLRAINTGHLDGQLKYQIALNAFTKAYPDSELVSYADFLIETSEDFKARQISSAKARFIQFFEQKHYFVLLYPNKPELSGQLPRVIDAFLTKNNWNYPSGNLLLTDEYSMVVVNNLPDKSFAMDVLTRFNQEKETIDLLKGRKHFVFALSQDNFDILYRTKDIDSYNQFFQQHYL